MTALQPSTQIVDDSALPRSMSCSAAPRKLRIALTYSRLPFPMMRGDQTTVAHLISFLQSRGHTVDFFTLDVDGAMSARQREWLSHACGKVRVFKHGRIAKLLGLLFGISRGLPLQVAIFQNRSMSRHLRRELVGGDYDIVYCYYPRTSMAVPEASSLPVRTASFLALQLSQTLNTARMAKFERNWLKRLVFHIETALVSRFEAIIWRRFDKVVLIGPADVAAVEEQCRRHGVPVIDNWIFGAHGTDTTKFKAATDDEIVENRVVFSGSMLYPPNIQAVLWFAEHVWPSVLSAVPNAHFVIQGRDPSRQIRQLDGSKNITVTGTVRDVGEVIRSAQVCVNPMRAAGGMQNKLIEYMASAKAVVATDVANEGIQAPLDAMVIANDAETFASEVVRLLTDVKEAARLGRRARDYVCNEWTWEKHFLDLEEAFLGATSDGWQGGSPSRDESDPLGGQA